MKQFKCSMSKKIESLAKKSEAKKNERGTTKIETYVGFDELLEYADAEYLLEDVVDVLSKYYTYEDDTFDEGQAKGDPEFTIKIEGGDERADFYSEDIFYVHLPNKEAAEELAKVLGGELSESKKPESRKKNEATKFIDSKIDALVAEISDKYGFTLQEKTKHDWETSWYLASGNTLGHMADGKIAIWINGFGAFLNLGYKVAKGYTSSVRKDIRTFDTLKKNLLANCEAYFGSGASESKKSKATTEDISVKLTELKDVTDAGKVLDDLKKLGFNTIEYGDYALKDKAYAVLKHPNGMYAELDYTWVQDSSGRDSYSPGEVVAYDYFKDKDEYEEIHGYSPNESKKNEDASSVDDLLARHNQKWLVKVSYDVDASHSAVAPSIVRADTKDAATNIALKRHRGLGYNMKVVSVEPMTESRKKSEGISDMIDAKIDYNMFMRMCKTAAYLEDDGDYWDALWDFYSEVGNIGDALVFFDNLFQYTAWKDVDETYDELDESDQDGSKSKEECIEAVLDRDGEIRGNLVRNYGDHYLWVY